MCSQAPAPEPPPPPPPAPAKRSGMALGERTDDTVRVGADGKTRRKVKKVKVDGDEV